MNYKTLITTLVIQFFLAIFTAYAMRATFLSYNYELWVANLAGIITLIICLGLLALSIWNAIRCKRIYDKAYAEYLAEEERRKKKRRPKRVAVAAACTTSGSEQKLQTEAVIGVPPVRKNNRGCKPLINPDGTIRPKISYNSKTKRNAAKERERQALIQAKVNNLLDSHDSDDQKSSLSFI